MNSPTFTDEDILFLVEFSCHYAQTFERTKGLTPFAHAKPVHLKPETHGENYNKGGKSSPLYSKGGESMEAQRNI